MTGAGEPEVRDVESFLKRDSSDRGVGSDSFFSPAKRQTAAPACLAPDRRLIIQ